MKSITIIIIFGFACLTASGLQAEIYSWTDENGVKHYGNTPPADRAAQIKTAREIPRQERIQIEQEKLEEKLAYLENLPPDAFANSRSRNVVIGQYQYRLQQLQSDPDSYFDKYGSR
jgi:hypothetical protein